MNWRSTGSRQATEKVGGSDAMMPTCAVFHCSLCNGTPSVQDALIDTQNLNLLARKLGTDLNFKQAESANAALEANKWALE